MNATKICLIVFSVCFVGMEGYAMMLGEGEGVLFIGAGDLDEWDTQKDMLNNLIGALLGLVLFYIFKQRHGVRQQPAAT